MKYRNMLGKCLLGYSMVIVALVHFAQVALAQTNGRPTDLTQIDPAPFADNSNHWYGIYDKHNIINPLPDRPKYKPTELKNIGDNILLFQKNNGGWSKNYDVFAILTNDQKDSLKARCNEVNTTFDNGTCYTQIDALAIVYHATNEEKYKKGALAGFGYILEAQYGNGGWPQFYPLETDYSRNITYNDGAMEGVMELLKAVLDNKLHLYDFLDAKLRKKLQSSYEKGLDCIIKTQINDAGKPTAWCQQHDEVTLEPSWARKFEPASICSSESAWLVLFLMSIDHPSKAIIDAIQNATAWFEASKIYNIRVDRIPAPPMVTPYKTSTTDKVVVVDSTAPPIWTRYYELKTHRPLFCNRDSKLVYSLAKVARERRDGYAWYSYTPQKVLNAYPEWQKKWTPDNSVLPKKN